MEKKRGRGRPRVTENIAGDNAELYEKILINGKQYHSRRSISDAAYVLTAAKIISEAASDIEGLELLINHQSQYVCRSILNQLGRMDLTDGYSDEDIVLVAKAAIQDKKNGYSVKEIEQYIRNGRLTGEW
jgi:predicted nucleotidyltransferase